MRSASAWSSCSVFTSLMPPPLPLPPAWIWAFTTKAQIHAGGRGKGGGIKLVKTLQELHAEADRMLGKPLVTPQTGPKGRVVRSVYVVEDTSIARELYL